MTKTVVDSAWPLKNPPKADVVLVYAGGDTPHTWTPAEVEAQPSEFVLPCWVRSNPPGPGVRADVFDFLQWLEANRVPKGATTVLDLESAVGPEYVQPFGSSLSAAGYHVIVYGSRGTLYQNPKLDGYYDAHPGEPVQVDPGNVATQYQWDGTYDLSDILDTVPLWNHKTGGLSIQPPAPPQPQPKPVSERRTSMPTVYACEGQPTYLVDGALLVQIDQETLSSLEGSIKAGNILEERVSVAVSKSIAAQVSSAAHPGQTVHTVTAAAADPNQGVSGHIVLTDEPGPDETGETATTETTEAPNPPAPPVPTV